MVKNLPARQETWVRSLGWEDSLEKGMATHFSILTWRIPQRSLAGYSRAFGTTNCYLNFQCVYFFYNFFKASIHNLYYPDEPKQGSWSGEKVGPRCPRPCMTDSQGSTCSPVEHPVWEQQAPIATSQALLDPFWGCCILFPRISSGLLAHFKVFGSFFWTISAQQPFSSVNARAMFLLYRGRNQTLNNSWKFWLEMVA